MGKPQTSVFLRPRNSKMVLPMKAMSAMKAMKAMKAGAMKSGAMTATGAYGAVAESTGLKPKDVKAAIEGLMAVAADQLKKNGSFKVGGAVNLKLKSRPARPARKGLNPFTRAMCIQSKTCIEDRQGFPDEETQRDDQLR